MTRRIALPSWLIMVMLCRMATAEGPLDQALARSETPATGTPANKAERSDAVPSDADAAVHAAILQLAQDGYARIRRDIRDYTCLMIKRERIDGRLHEYQYMEAKVRHARDDGAGNVVPFSVYLKFLAPEDLRGREVLYVAGQNDGKLIARKGGLRFAYITTRLDPESELAMEDNRYPITEFGFENLTRRMLQHMESHELQGCLIERRTGAKVDGRPCLAIQITNPTPSRDADFHLARVYIDDVLQIPIHYEAFDWPARGQTEPQLIEQYTYRHVKLNVGLTDSDFRRDNPAYGFRKE